MLELDDAITYVYGMHKHDGTFNKDGWIMHFPDRYKSNAEEGLLHITKLNKLMLMKLHMLDQDMFAWALRLIPGNMSWDVDSMFGTNIQGLVRAAQRGGVTEEERQRIEKRRRDSNECKFIFCRHWPRDCKHEKRCKYLHPGQN